MPSHNTNIIEVNRRTDLLVPLLQLFGVIIKMNHSFNLCNNRKYKGVSLRII
jgi:hypothetical protein